MTTVKKDVKTVGRRRPPADLLDPARDNVASAVGWRTAFPTPFIPRGVYRFQSHQEADAWLWQMITRRRKAKTN
ncbi:MAG TPA: hypothetical protein VF020_16845 [Chthoniobacterales bacterium]